VTSIELLRLGMHRSGLFAALPLTPQRGPLTRRASCALAARAWKPDSAGRSRTG
jgi:hypothetical protein